MSAPVVSLYHQHQEVSVFKYHHVFEGLILQLNMAPPALQDFKQVNMLPLPYFILFDYICLYHFWRFPLKNSTEFPSNRSVQFLLSKLEIIAFFRFFQLPVFAAFLFTELSIILLISLLKLFWYECLFAIMRLQYDFLRTHGFILLIVLL